MSAALNARPGWRPATLEELVVFQRGYDITKAEQKPGEVPVVSSSGINSYHSESMVDGPGVVIGRKGSLGTVHFVDGPYWPHDTTLWSKELNGNNARFVFYFLHTMDLQRYDVGSSNPTLNRNHIHGLFITIPEAKIQERIVAVLSAYDDLIENNRRRIQLLEQAARLLYKEWFVHLRFPGHEHVTITDGVPEGWELRPLGRCAKFLSGGTPSKARSEFWNGDIPWVSSGELKGMRIHRTKLNVTPEAVADGSRIVPPGTILAVVRGMSLAKEFRIGVTAKTVAFNQDLKAIVSGPNVDALFLFCAIEAQRDVIRERASDASHGTKKLDTPVLFEVPITVPPPTVQALFRQHVYPLHAQWDNFDIQIEKLRTARDLILPRLMNGEIAA